MAGDSRTDDYRKVSTFHNNLQSNEKSTSTQYSVDLLETIFAFIDEDCDGLLSLNEMRTFLQNKVGISISVEELQALLSNNSNNNTSTENSESSSSSSTSSLFMDFQQFESILAGESYSPSSNLESKKNENATGKNHNNDSSKPKNNDDDDDDDDDDVKDCFCVFDTDGDGFISARELQSCLARMGLRSREGLGYEVEECEGMIAKIDLDGNGLVDLYEFKEMMSLLF